MTTKDKSKFQEPTVEHFPNFPIASQSNHSQEKCNSHSQVATLQQIYPTPNRLLLKNSSTQWSRKQIQNSISNSLLRWIWGSIGDLHAKSSRNGFIRWPNSTFEIETDSRIGDAIIGSLWFCVRIPTGEQRRGRFDLIITPTTIPLREPSLRRFQHRFLSIRSSKNRENFRICSDLGAEIGLWNWYPPGIKRFWHVFLEENGEEEAFATKGNSNGPYYGQNKFSIKK